MAALESCLYSAVVTVGVELFGPSVFDGVDGVTVKLLKYETMGEYDNITTVYVVGLRVSYRFFDNMVHILYRLYTP